MDSVFLAQRRRRPILRYSLLAIALVAIALLGLMGCERRLVYFPDASRTSPAEAGLPSLREAVLTMEDGTRVITWRGEPASPDGPMLIYFHGNGSSLRSRAPLFNLFVRAGYGLAALSYRGYGGSEGSPTEANNVSDAIALYDALRAEGVPAERIVLYGESLGTGVAVQVAAARPVAGVILQSPYSAVSDVAAGRYGLFFADWIMQDAYRSREFIADIDAPLLWIHGRADRVVPLRFGQRLFDLAQEPKTAAIYDEAGHNDLYRYGAFEPLRAFVAEVVGG